MSKVSPLYSTAVAAAALLGAALLPGAAIAAGTTGTISLTGTVTNKCSVTTGGSGGSFAGSYNLGELAGADGTLSTTLSATTAGASAFSLPFTLTCTSANATVAVESTALANTAVATAPAGYTRAVDFTGRASLDLVANPSGSSILDVDDTSSVGGATSNAFGAANYLANTPNNVRVSAYAFTTGSGQLLVAGPYAGQIVVTITP